MRCARESSGRRGTPGRAAAPGRGHPDLEVVLATGDTQAGTAVADLYPSLAAAYPDLVLRAVRPGRGRRPRPGVPGPAPRGLAATSCPTLRKRVRRGRRPGRRLPPEGRRRCTRRGTARPTAAPSCWPRPPTACPSCSGTRSPGATLVAAPGCYVDRRRPGPGPAGARRRDRARPGSSSTPPPACRAPAGRLKADHPLLHGRRGLHRLRPARPPPHPRDRAGAPAPRSSSPPTWPR